MEDNKDSENIHNWFKQECYNSQQDWLNAPNQLKVTKDQLDELNKSIIKNKGKERLDEIRKLCSKLDKIPNEHSKVTIPKIKTNELIPSPDDLIKTFSTISDNDLKILGFSKNKQTKIL